MRGLGVQGLFEPGMGGFLLGFALRLFAARLHRAGGLDRAGLLGEPDVAEVALADVGEDVRDFGLVQRFAFSSSSASSSRTSRFSVRMA